MSAVSECGAARLTTAFSRFQKREPLPAAAPHEPGVVPAGDARGLYQLLQDAGFPTVDIEIHQAAIARGDDRFLLKWSIDEAGHASRRTDRARFVSLFEPIRSG